MVYRYTDGNVDVDESIFIEMSKKLNGDDYHYTKQAVLISQHLKTLPTEFKVAVLCGWRISARRLTELLRREIGTHSHWHRWHGVGSSSGHRD